MNKPTIGIIGLGIMGRGITNNFLQKGYSVFIWNRTNTIMEEFIKKGAISCSSPAEVTSKADIIFEITANDESSRIVWLGRDGILSGATSQKILIASATLSIQWIDELIKLCNGKNFTFFDIALTGGKIGAETGNLTLLVGGNETKLEELKLTLNAIASKIVYFGTEGQGMRYKLILNFLQALHIVGFGEAMKIARSYDMDLKKVADALTDRPGGVITGIANKAYFAEPDPITFSIEWITKDLTYAKQMAKDLNLPLLNDVLEEYKAAIDKGLEKKDWTSVNNENR